MSVTQLTLLTSLSMMGAGIIMLPAKFAEIGAISMLSWIVTALASGVRRLLTAASIAQRFAQFKNVLRDGLIRHYRTIPQMRNQFRSRNHMVGMPSEEN